MRFTAQPMRRPLRGTVFVPGDKSISHRAVLFSALAEGTSRLTGVLDSEDVRSTIGAVSALGAKVSIDAEADGLLDATVTGWGTKGPSRPSAPIDCGNSGTTARLLMGVLAGWDIEAVLSGDESLSRRPMRRVTSPLSEMGASFELSPEGTLPVTVHGGGLHPIDYTSPVASAQVKTAILLAGLRAEGRTSVTEPSLSRDHTERLLPAFGVPVVTMPEACTASIDGPSDLSATDMVVPRDPSSAAFMVGAALLVPGSDVWLPGVSINPTRVGFLAVLERMGAFVEVSDEPSLGAEPVGTIRARGGVPLRPTTVIAEEVPSLVDEVPLLAVVASQAEGTTRFEGVEELRVKESDRLEAVRAGLETLGVTVRAGQDWLEVDGPTRMRSCELASLGDHRLAMAWTVAALVADGPVHIERYEAVAVSYPRFAEDLAALAGS